MKKNIITSVMAATLLLTASCQYKDFDDYAGMMQVKVIADYSDAQADSIPAVTRSIFYPVSGNNPYTYDLKDSAVVDLPDGTYSVFAYNNDSEINRTRAYSFQDGAPVIYTDKADYRGIFPVDSLDHTVYYDYPDVTYAYYGISTVNGVPDLTTPDDNRIVLKMKKVTREVKVTVIGMKNTKYISGLRMSVSGMQKDYSPVSGYNNTFVSVVADGSVDKDSTLTSDFYVFGSDKTGHVLTVHIDGGNFHKVLQFDVTDQVNAQLPGSAPIVIRVTTDYDVKDDVPVKNGFDVDVDDWQDEPIPIDL